MKKQFEMPVVNINMFSTENLITASGEAPATPVDNAVAMAQSMSRSVTQVDFKNLNITL